MSGWLCLAQRSCPSCFTVTIYTAGVTPSPSPSPSPSPPHFHFPPQVGYMMSGPLVTIWDVIHTGQLISARQLVPPSPPPPSLLRLDTCPAPWPPSGTSFRPGISAAAWLRPSGWCSSGHWDSSWAWQHMGEIEGGEGQKCGGISVGSWCPSSGWCSSGHWGSLWAWPQMGDERGGKNGKCGHFLSSWVYTDVKWKRSASVIWALPLYLSTLVKCTYFCCSTRGALATCITQE